MKKIAIFHNFLDNIGGAEYVDLLLARKMNADIYTTNINTEKIKKMGFEDVISRIYSIGRVPINAPLRQEIAYWKFRKLNVEKKFEKKYDVYIIAGDWAMSGAIHNKPNLWYVYSPTREIWDLYKYTRKNSVPAHLRIFFDIWVFLRRIINKHDSKKVQKALSISQNVKKRVKNYLNLDSKVIYPPVKTSECFNKKSKGYWISINRLISHKRIEMQIKAFEKMPEEKLIIIGSYEKSRHFKSYSEYINEIKPSNVEIISWVDEKEKFKLLSECKGMIFTAFNEDFGISPVEAMASGKPVIAPNEGGCKETMINGKTGILIDNINSDKIVQAIKEINHELKKNPLKYKSFCQKHAKNFDSSIFIKKMKEEIEKIKGKGFKKDEKKFF